MPPVVQPLTGFAIEVAAVTFFSFILLSGILSHHNCPEASEEIGVLDVANKKQNRITDVLIKGYESGISI
jgi:hypothetical protein